MNEIINILSDIQHFCLVFDVYMELNGCVIKLTKYYNIGAELLRYTQAYTLNEIKDRHYSIRDLFYQFIDNWKNEANNYIEREGEHYDS